MYTWTLRNALCMHIFILMIGSFSKCLINSVNIYSKILTKEILKLLLLLNECQHKKISSFIKTDALDFQK